MYTTHLKPIIDPKKNMLMFSLSSFHRLSCCLLGMAFFGVHAHQNHRVSLAWEDTSIHEALADIEAKSPYLFFYETDLIRNYPEVSMAVQNTSVKTVLDSLFKESDISFKLLNSQIVLKKKKQKTHVKAITPDQTQTQTIEGRILNTSGLPIVGVTVVIKNTSQGTTSDYDGSFKLSLRDPEAVLVFSHLGYKSLEVPLAGKDIIVVVLEEDISSLDEVVLLGYNQGAKRQHLTGSIATLKGDKMVQIGSTNIDTALAGQIPGVQVTRNSGQAGEGASIRIRGTTSVLGSNEPLYVVDGVPMTSSFESFFAETSLNDSDGSSFSPLSPLTSLAPEDIANITVLKDASATAIYGSRGANGVVLIETKTGLDSPRVQFGYSFSSYSPARLMDMLNASQLKSFLTPIMEKLRAENPFSQVPDPNEYFLKANTDWQKAILQKAPKHNYHLSFSDQGKRSTYQVSLNVVDEKGIVQKTNFKRYGARIRLSSTPTHFLTLGLQANYSQTEQNLQQNIFLEALRTRPDIPAYNPDGSIYRYFDPDEVAVGGVSSRFSTPLQRIDARKNTKTTNRFFGSVYAEATLVPELKLRSSLFLDQSSTQSLLILYPRRIQPLSGTRYDNRQDFQSLVFDQTLNYTPTFGQDHHLDLLLGVSFTHNNTTVRAFSGSRFDNENLVYPQNAGQIDNRTLNKIPEGLLSYLGRINYDYQNKYLATLTFRRDASTKFGANNQWGNFPSMALAWNVGEEVFLKETKHLDNLKLRASWGITGSSNFGNFLFASFYNQGTRYKGIEGRIPQGIGNHNIRWEKTLQTDLGIDFALWNRRLSGSVNYYNKKTDDLLLVARVPLESGFQTQITNAGTVRNKGLEIDLRAQLINTPEWSWDVSTNVSWNTNRVEALNSNLDQQQSMTSWGYNRNSILKEGEPLGAFYGYKVDQVINTQEELNALNASSPSGVYQSPLTAVGDYKFADLDGNGFIDHRDQTVIGNPNPKAFGGLNTSLRYKRWTFQTDLQFQYGNQIALVNRLSVNQSFGSFYTDYLSYQFNYRSEILNRWTPDNPNSSLAASQGNDYNNNRRFSNRSVYDGSFLRLKNVRLSYRVVQMPVWLKALSNLNVFVSGTNIWTWTKYPGLDPEVVSQPGYNNYNGFDQSFFPQTQFYSLGFTAAF